MLGMTMSSRSRSLILPTPAQNLLDQITFSRISSSEVILEMWCFQKPVLCVCALVSVCARPEGASVLPLTVTDSTMLVGSVLLLFSP